MNKLFLLLALTLSLALAQTDDCLTYSYASGTTNQITSLDVSLFSNINSAAGINSALRALLTLALSSSSPFLQNIYVAQSGTEDFYMIKNCATQQGPNPYCSSSGPKYVAYVRNTAFYTNNVRHVFAVVDNTVDVTVAANTLAPETETYVPSTRSWFAVNGWTGLITYVAGGQGKTFVKPFGTGLVAASDRPMNEYCGPCMSNSNAVAIAQALAVSNFASTVAGIKNVAGFSDVGKIIKAAVDVVKSPYNVNSNIGLNNGDSYMFKNCAGDFKDGSAECNGQNFLLYVTNQAVYGDNVRRVFSMNADGSVKDLIATLSSYIVTEREWFQVQNGWSDTYSFASASSASGRTYAIAVNGGVVGSGRLNSEPCSTEAQAQCEVTSSSIKIVSSLLMLVASAMVLLF